MKVLLREDPCVDVVNVKGSTVVHLLCESGATSQLQLFLKHCQSQNVSIDLDLADIAGFTPLMLACKHGFDDIADILLEYGASLSKCNELTGRNPLHIAASKGYIEVLLVLLKAGADISTKCKHRKNAEEYAKLNDHRQAAIFLRKLRHQDTREFSLAIQYN